MSESSQEERIIDLSERICSALGNVNTRVHCERVRGLWRGWVVIGSADTGHRMEASAVYLGDVLADLGRRAVVLRDLLHLISPEFPERCTPAHASADLLAAAAPLTDSSLVMDGWSAYRRGDYGDDPAPRAVAEKIAQARVDCESRARLREAAARVRPATAAKPTKTQIKTLRTLLDAGGCIPASSWTNGHGLQTRRRVTPIYAHDLPLEFACGLPGFAAQAAKRVRREHPRCQRVIVVTEIRQARRAVKAAQQQEEADRV